MEKGKLCGSVLAQETGVHITGKFKPSSEPCILKWEEFLQCCSRWFPKSGITLVLRLRIVLRKEECWSILGRTHTFGQGQKKKKKLGDRRLELGTEAK